jgi:YHS domain-containing protein
MNSNTSARALRFEELNWVATAPLPRDCEPSHLLHQPDYLIGTIDPITGHDIGAIAGHPFVVDGKLTIYFETEETRRAFLETPLNHPYIHALGRPSALDDRGG